MTQLVVHHDCDSVIPEGLLFESCKPFLKIQEEIGTNSCKERKKTAFTFYRQIKKSSPNTIYGVPVSISPLVCPSVAIATPT